MSVVDLSNYQAAFAGRLVSTNGLGLNVSPDPVTLVPLADASYIAELVRRGWVAGDGGVYVLDSELPALKKAVEAKNPKLLPWASRKRISSNPVQGELIAEFVAGQNRDKGKATRETLRVYNRTDNKKGFIAEVFIFDGSKTLDQYRSALFVNETDKGALIKLSYQHTDGSQANATGSLVNGQWGAFFGIALDRDADSKGSRVNLKCKHYVPGSFDIASVNQMLIDSTAEAAKQEASAPAP